MSESIFKVLGDNEALSTFREAKDLFWKKKFYYLVIIGIPILLSLILGKFFGHIGSLIDFFVSPCLFVGQMIIFQKELNGEKSIPHDLFTVFKQDSADKAMSLLKFLFARFLFAVALAIVTAIVIGVGFFALRNRVDLTNLATQILLLMPIAVIVVFFFFASTFFSIQLVWFKGLQSLESFQLSWEACLANTWPLTWWGLVSLGINFLGAITIIGIFFTLPITFIATYLLYKKIFLEEVTVGIQTP